ncbi:hypothetical protein D5125_17300 [Magnetovirga frankeli]|jgi:hypothetical protein|uniref:hypothetical protein n=1 Tax=Magnetovirga frankeli TaxID=947516 RepID=UPI00129340BD|nr:hypothetical protein D5125_17300 [gamma proteobacterium SS-5]
MKIVLTLTDAPDGTVTIEEERLPAHTETLGTVTTASVLADELLSHAQALEEEE